MVRVARSRSPFRQTRQLWNSSYSFRMCACTLKAPSHFLKSAMLQGPCVSPCTNKPHNISTHAQLGTKCLQQSAQGAHVRQHCSKHRDEEEAPLDQDTTIACGAHHVLMGREGWGRRIDPVCSEPVAAGPAAAALVVACRQPPFASHSCT